MTTNGFNEGMSNMDNLTIFINKDEQIEIKGMMRDLKDGELIQARLLKSNLMIMVDDNPELYNKKFMYFKSLDDLAFRRLITNYLYYKQVPGIVMTNINGTYYDSELDEAHLHKVIENLGKLATANRCNKNVEVESISDLLFSSNDFNPEQEHIVSTKFQTVSQKLEKTIDKVRNKLGADTAEELNNNICGVIKLMSRDQFKLGYSLGLEYLADLSGLPGNTISERVKAELNMSE